MELTPREKDKLLIFTAALLAERPQFDPLRDFLPVAIPGAATELEERRAAVTKSLAEQGKLTPELAAAFDVAGVQPLQAGLAAAGLIAVFAFLGFVLPDAYAARRADRVAVGDQAAFGIHRFLTQPCLAHHREGNYRDGLVDLGAQAPEAVVRDVDVDHRIFNKFARNRNKNTILERTKSDVGNGWVARRYSRTL